MADKPCPRIVIVGGGLSGLTTAYRLLEQAHAAKRQIELTLLEARDRVGGMAVAFQMNGHTVEHGSHGFFGSGIEYYVNSVNLTREMNTYDGLYQVPGWTLVHRSNRRALMKHSRCLPRLLDVLPAIMRVPWLSFWGKLRACWAAFRLSRIKYEDYLPLDEMNGYELGRKKGYDHEGALTWNMASLGLTNQFVDGDPEHGDPGLSGVLFAGKHRALIHSKQGLSYLLPSGDLSEVLAEPLAKRITELGGTIELGAKVEGVDREARTVRYTGAKGEVSVEFDDLVLAIQPWAAAKLVDWLEHPWQSLKPTTPVITMTMQLSGRVTESIDGRELGLSRKDWPFSVITDLSRFWPEYAAEATGDKTVFRVEIGHADLPPGEGTPEEIVAAAKTGLDRLYPECKELTVEWCEMNHEKELLYVSWLKGEWGKRPKPSEREVAGDVYLAGDWTTRGTIGMEAAVISGYEAVNWVSARHGWKPVEFPQVPI